MHQPCAFAAGQTDKTPECSAALVLSTCRERFHREAIARTCDTGRYRMPFWLWGEGPPLVVIPGLCDDAESFVLPLARLSAKFCCIVYDHPSGVSDGARMRTYRHGDLVDDLFALCDHLRIDSAALLGVSFGSTVALPALARDARRFPVGMLLGGFVRRPLAWAEVLLASLARYWRGTLAQLPLHREIVTRNHAEEFASLEPARWPFFLEKHGKAANAAVAQRALWIHRFDGRALLPRITQRMLLIRGEKDCIVGRPCYAELCSGLPNSLRAEIDGCGHLPQFTHPEVLSEVIEQFILNREHGPAMVQAASFIQDQAGHANSSRTTLP